VGAREVADRFYGAFARRDGAAMAACYAPDATFSDPVFPQLDGTGAGAMWRMLCERGADLVVTHRIESEDGDRVVVRWDADYTFSTTGKKVHNEITATLVVRGEHIVAHTDVFDFWRWSRQALGVTGWLLGWSGSLQGKVRSTAAGQLDKWRAKHPT
jgi:ketosteroid isomerase-like protein